MPAFLRRIWPSPCTRNIGINHTNDYPGYFAFCQTIGARDLRVIPCCARFERRVYRRSRHAFVPELLFENCKLCVLTGSYFSSITFRKDFPVLDYHYAYLRTALVSSASHFMASAMAISIYLLSSVRVSSIADPPNLLSYQLRNDWGNRGDRSRLSANHLSVSSGLIFSLQGSLYGDLQRSSRGLG